MISWIFFVGLFCLGLFGDPLMFDFLKKLFLIACILLDAFVSYVPPDANSSTSV